MFNQFLLILRSHNTSLQSHTNIPPELLPVFALNFW